MLDDLVVTVGRGAATLGRLGLGEVFAVLLGRAVDRLLEDGLRLVDIELGLESRDVVGEATAVCAAASVSEAEVLVNDLLAGVAPRQSYQPDELCIKRRQ